MQLVGNAPRDQQHQRTGIRPWTDFINLSLDETQVTDAGLRELYKLKNLRRISLWKTQVTDRGVADLQKALPDLEINR